MTSISTSFNHKGAIAADGTLHLLYRRLFSGSTYHNYLITRAPDGTVSPVVDITATVGVGGIMDFELLPDGRQLIMMSDVARPIYVRAIPRGTAQIRPVVDT